MNYIQTNEKQKQSSLLLLSGFSFSLILFRIAVTHTVFYGFLIFNLVLATIPFLISTFLLNYSIANRKWLLLLASAGWLLFLPNAPYILTDFLHFKRESDMPEWFDILMLASFTCSGLAFCFVSMADMHGLWKSKFGTPTAKGFIFSSCLLSGFGIYLGRFVRYNSWDLLHSPIDLLSSLPSLLFELKAIGFSLGYGLFIFLFYNFFNSHKKQLIMNTNIMSAIHYQSKSGILSTQMAITSFVGGTVIMLLSYLYPQEDFIFVIGLFYVAIAFLVNAAMLVLLVYFFLKEEEHREYFAVKILILLANIPIAILYFCIVFNLNPLF